MNKMTSSRNVKAESLLKIGIVSDRGSPIAKGKLSATEDLLSQRGNLEQLRVLLKRIARNRRSNHKSKAKQLRAAESSRSYWSMTTQKFADSAMSPAALVEAKRSLKQSC
jgi:hypothetical protein